MKAAPETSSQAAAPSAAMDAVLVASEPVPEGSHQVRGVDFDRFRGRDITVAEMVDNMTHMGFQGSAVAEAAQIINEMVSAFPLLGVQCANAPTAGVPSPRNRREDYHFPRLHV